MGPWFWTMLWGEFGLAFWGGASEDLGMLWETIDSLANTELSLRSDELRERLEGCSDQELALFCREAVEVYRRVFVPRNYRLYCIAFEGETNGSGLTDFCSNLMLSGRSLVEAVLRDPDAFADVPAAAMVAFNDDSGAPVASVGWRILRHRHHGDVPQELCKRGGEALFDGLWEELEEHVGPIDFEPDWPWAETALPRIVARARGV